MQSIRMKVFLLAFFLSLLRVVFASDLQLEGSISTFDSDVNDFIQKISGRLASGGEFDKLERESLLKRAIDSLNANFINFVISSVFKGIKSAEILTLQPKLLREDPNVELILYLQFSMPELTEAVMIAARAFHQNDVRICVHLCDHPFFDDELHLPLLEELYSYRQIDMEHEMMQFVHSGRYDLVFFFTLRGVDINYLSDPESKDLNVLSFAICNKAACSLQCLKDLIAAGARLQDGVSMLSLAISAENYEFAEYLIGLKEPHPEIWTQLVQTGAPERLFILALLNEYPLSVEERESVIRFLELSELKNVFLEDEFQANTL